MTYRLMGLLVVLVAILVLPYWLYIPILFLVVILVPFFWEGILLAFLIAVLYGGELKGELEVFPSIAAYVLLFLVVLLPVRERLRFYA